MGWLAWRQQCWHYACMTVQITIRNVPDEVRDELAVRAARARQSMQEYLLSELERLASRPSPASWAAEVRERKRAYGVEVPAQQILGHRDADRR